MLPFEQLSYWEKSTFFQKVDFLIVGSGIVGLSTAIHLKQRFPFKKVLVIDRGYLPTGASTKNAGFACIGSASEILDDLKHYPEQQVFETIEKRWRGLQYLRHLLKDEAIDFQKNGSNELFLIGEREHYEYCIEQLAFLNSQLENITNIPRVFQPNSQHLNKSGFQNFEHAISNATEGQIDTGKMVSSLLKLAHSCDVKIVNSITVKQIDQNFVDTNQGKIIFDKLAICTNGLAKQFLPNEDVLPARAQVVVTSPIENLKLNGIYHFDKGYYYFRNVDNRVLFGGGRNLNFEAEETDELNTSDQIINHLSSLLETHILPQHSFSIEHYWAGTMGIGKGKLPIVKQLDKNLYCGVRLGGMGVAIGSLVGKELAELIY